MAKNDKHLEIIEEFTQKNERIFSKKYFYTFENGKKELMYPPTNEKLNELVAANGKVLEIYPSEV